MDLEDDIGAWFEEESSVRGKEVSVGSGSPSAECAIGKESDAAARGEIARFTIAFISLCQLFALTLFIEESDDVVDDVVVAGFDINAGNPGRFGDIGGEDEIPVFVFAFGP